MWPLLWTTLPTRTSRTSPQPHPTGRADALVDLLEEIVARLHAETTIDTTKAEVAVILDYDTLIAKAGGTGELDGGTPLRGDGVRRLACDAGIVRIVTKGHSEILDLGTKTRQWNAAQRRAIRYRFGGRCFVPGCDRRIVELHHTNPVGEGGATDLDDALPACKGHHHLVHEGGWTASYDPITGIATLHRPQRPDHLVPALPPDPGDLTQSQPEPSGRRRPEARIREFRYGSRLIARSRIGSTGILRCAN